MSAGTWPELPFDAWRETSTTLHLWTQIVGKVRLRQTAWINHSWHVTLYVTTRGLTTTPIPVGGRTFQMDFDFLDQVLRVETSDDRRATFPLVPQTVASFHANVVKALDEVGVQVRIHGRPNEVVDAIPFARDHAPRAYDGEYARRYWQVLVQVDRVFKTFRARFLGKASPVHYFWGAPDLAVTRFSGRPAPAHPGGIPNLPDAVVREAYSHEVSSCGFWPGGGSVPYAAFYSYAYPEPPGFAAATVSPAEAYYSRELREFLLPYDAVRLAPSPDERLLDFLQSTYEAAAGLGNWDREGLERAHGYHP